MYQLTKQQREEFFWLFQSAAADVLSKIDTRTRGNHPWFHMNLTERMAEMCMLTLISAYEAVNAAREQEEQR
jgi:hypothetical protein